MSIILKLDEERRQERTGANDLYYRFPDLTDPQKDIAMRCKWFDSILSWENFFRKGLWRVEDSTRPVITIKARPALISFFLEHGEQMLSDHVKRLSSGARFDPNT